MRPPPIHDDTLLRLTAMRLAKRNLYRRGKPHPKAPEVDAEFERQLQRLKDRQEEDHASAQHG